MGSTSRRSSLTPSPPLPSGEGGRREFPLSGTERGTGGEDGRGFTLIEILVVIIVLGLLAALVGPRILGRVSEAKTATARTQIELLGLALDNYRLDNGSYPTTEQGLNALQEKPTRDPVPLSWRGPYLKKAIPLDPWGRPYLYESPGEHNPAGYDLSTLGRDGQPGGKDEDADITSWQ
jgi:general secretion pathway protein G